MNDFKLITFYKDRYHVSEEITKEFEREISREIPVALGNSLIGLSAKIFNALFRVRFLNRIISYLYISKNNYVLICMGTNFKRSFPYFLTRGNKVLYMFDAWPNSHEYIYRFIKRLNVQYTFFSSSMVTADMQKRGVNCFWVPEGIELESYRFELLANKDIDVVAIGRKYDEYHEMIMEPLENAGKVYLYEKIKGQIIFPTQEEFFAGLARAKISICVPSNVTHPERSGNIETMTIRYLQSMLSKCLIVGIAPTELIELFEYNPVVEIDMNEPVGQILDILENYSNYIELVEKNYQMVRQNHSWENRWMMIKHIINNRK